MKKIAKLILLAFALLLSYEAVAVYKARSVTTEKFTKILNPAEIKIQLVDMPQQRIDTLLKIQDPNFFNHNGLDFQTAGAGLTTITQAMGNGLDLSWKNKLSYGSTV